MVTSQAAGAGSRGGVKLLETLARQNRKARKVGLGLAGLGQGLGLGGVRLPTHCCALLSGLRSVLW